MKALIIHGPNLNLLGRREPHLYGLMTLEEINAGIEEWAYKNGWEIASAQCNSEGEIIEKIHGACGCQDLILLNPAAYTHTSLAIADALRAVGVPAIEVHLTNIFAREESRRVSLTAPACVGLVCGFGMMSYILALEAGAQLLSEANPDILGRKSEGE
mgnify:CR=1 FL=1